MFVYNFLDFRHDFFGRRVIEQMDLQLPAAFRSRSIQVQVLDYRRMGIQPAPAISTGGAQSVVMLPIREAIIANQASEQATGACYRLLIIPANVMQNRASQTYEVRWVLMEVATGAQVWTLLTRSSRLTVWRNDENSEARVRDILDQVFADFRASGLID